MDSWLLNENGDGTVLLHNLTDKSVADFKIPLRSVRSARL